MSELLPSLTIEPNEPARTTMIWLHGLGADGYDFEHIVPELRLPADTAVRFVFPHAPNRPVTINDNHVMPAWFDIKDLNWLTTVDEQGVRTSIQQITNLIAQQRSLGMPSERIILAGFSQGGVIALHTAARYHEKLGGVIALSTYLPMHMEMAAEINPLNRDIPIFMAHGELDPMVPIIAGRESCTSLRGIQPNVEWREYPIDHHVSPDEIIDIRRWLENIPAMA